MTAADALARMDPAHGEAGFQRAVIELAEIYRWRVFFTANSKHSPPGELDLRMVRPPRVAIAELKTDIGTLTDEQADTVELLNRCPGVECYVWRPADWPTIERVLKPDRSRDHD